MGVGRLSSAETTVAPAAMSSPPPETAVAQQEKSDGAGHHSGEKGAYWDERDIRIWMKVTMNLKMQHSSESLHELQEQLRERWKLASPHIAPSMRGEIQKVIEKDSGISLD